MTHAMTFDTTAHRLLDDLDRRHDELLAELDALDQRVTAVLSQYVQIRPESPEQSGETAAQIADADDDGDGDEE